MVELKHIYYAAALLEGEGSFVIVGKTPTIQINMTDLEPIRMIRNIMAPYASIRCYNKGRYKPIYRFGINGQHAIEWMMTLYPLMSPRRRERIRELIIYWQGKNSERGHKFSVNTRTKNLKLISGGMRDI